MSLAAFLIPRIPRLDYKLALFSSMSTSTPSRGLYTPPNRRNWSSRGGRTSRGQHPYPRTPPLNTEEAENAGVVRRGIATATLRVAQDTSAPVQGTPRASSPVGISQTRFLDFVNRGRISSTLLANNPYEFCTEVQAATMDTILDGVDV
jgi:hypothetical protein